MLVTYALLFIAFSTAGKCNVRELLTKKSSLDWFSNIEEHLSQNSSYCNICCIDLQVHTIGKKCGLHTLCRYPDDKAGPACIGLVTIHFTNTEKEALVDLHNTFRNKVASGQVQLGSPGPQPKAANMRMIEWSEELAGIARRWASQCIYGHDICRDLDRFPVGQNIAKGNVARSTEIYLVEEWFQNVRFFNNSLVESFKLFEHKKQKISLYSQVVWADTYLLGCARAIFQHPSSSNISYKEHLICNYGPTGNIPNQPVYKIGEPCSKCQEGTSCTSTYPSLCASEEIYEMHEPVEGDTHRKYYSAVLSVFMLLLTLILK